MIGLESGGILVSCHLLVRYAKFFESNGHLVGVGTSNYQVSLVSDCLILHAGCAWLLTMTEKRDGLEPRHHHMMNVILLGNLIVNENTSSQLHRWLNTMFIRDPGRNVMVTSIVAGS